MPKRKIIQSAAFILLALALVTLGYLVSTAPSGKRTGAGTVKESDLREQMPDVPCIDGVKKEMLGVSYWVSEETDELLFSTEEIEDIRENNPFYVLYKDASGRLRKLYERHMEDTLPKQTISSLLDKDLIKEMRDGKTLYVNGEKADDEYFAQIDKNRNFENIAAEVKPAYAMCIRRTMAMTIPSDDFVSDDKDEKFINDIVSAEIMPFTGVILLHKSADGEWLYVLNGSFCGWVHKEDLALCRNRSDWNKACNPEKFLMVTGEKIVLDETAVPTQSSGMILPMGTKLKLADEQDEAVNGRSTLGCWTVEIPVRDEEGHLAWEQAAVPVSRDVHEGYLTMTSSSVLNQAFKFLGQVYGWGGSLSSNDCSGMIRQIYSCYGFELPRNGRAIAQLYSLGSFDCTDMTEARKLSVLEKMPAGLPLYMDGHLMLYLGMDDGEPYVISSCASFIPQSGGEEFEANCVFVSNLELLRKNGNTWLRDLSFFDWKEY